MGRKKMSAGGNKSEFCRNMLQKDSSVTHADVNAAWKAEGNKDEINPTLYYLQKRKLGLTKKGRGRKKTATKTTAVASVSNGSYESIEKQLDKLVAQAGELRDSKLADALLAARRHASAKLI